MNELILDLVQGAGQPPALLRLPLDGGAMVVGFLPPPFRPPRNVPSWIAKTAEGAAACRRLRAEAHALAQLAPQAQVLGVPQLLGWREAIPAAAPAACLVQSALPGRPRRCRWRWRRGQGALPPSLPAAGDWLRRFQRLVPAPRAASLGALAAEACANAAADQHRYPEYATLLAAILTPLAAARAAAEVAPAVAIHGDFWAGNLLLAPRRWGAPGAIVGVIDWSGFDAGSPLDDLLTFVGHLDCGLPAPAGTLARWLRVFFAPSRPREFLRAWAAATALAAPAARLAFYLFLVRRLRWELGLALQARSPIERARAQGEWDETLAWLARNHYPDPFLG